MKFTALPAHDLTDVTLDLEQLQTRDILDQSSTTILQLAVTGTKRKVATGTDSATWTASNTSGLVTVSHGLGVTPILYGAWAADGNTVWFAGSAPSSTQVKFKGDYYTVLTLTVAFNWIAIG